MAYFTLRAHLEVIVLKLFQLIYCESMSKLAFVECFELVMLKMIAKNILHNAVRKITIGFFYFYYSCIKMGIMK
jgi:hypothetical protein